MKNSEQIREFIKQYQNISGIYAIVCGDKRYVGSSVNIGRRIESHFTNLNRDKHYNQVLQFDFNLKKMNFEVVLLELCNEYTLLTKEFEWKNKFINIYNKTNESLEVKLTFEQEIYFWTKVRISDENSCWNWIGCLDKDNYGRISFRINRKKSMFRANRLAYYLMWPDHNKDLLVRHKCNNPVCCNPTHLELGSSAENKKDILKDKGTIFTIEQVKLIRQKLLLEPNIKQAKLAEWVKTEFNIQVKPSIIMSIGFNKRYYDPDYTPPKRYIDDEVAKFIRSFSNKEVTIKSIIDVVNSTFNLKLNNMYIWRILKNQRVIDKNYTFINKIIKNKYSNKT